MGGRRQQGSAHDTNRDIVDDGDNGDNGNNGDNGDESHKDDYASTGNEGGRGDEGIRGGDHGVAVPYRRSLRLSLGCSSSLADPNLSLRLDSLDRSKLSASIELRRPPPCKRA